jgi:hypothetical protein
MTEHEATARWWIDAGLLADLDVAPSTPGAPSPALRVDGAAGVITVEENDD